MEASRTALKSQIAQFLMSTGMLRGLEFVRQADGAVVFTLHRVLPREEFSAVYNPNLIITPESFEGFLQFVSFNYQLVLASELVQRMIDGRSVKGLAAVTFDDGWEDNFTVAFPLLKKHRVPGTVFVVTAHVGTDSLLPEERIGWIWRNAVDQSRIRELLHDCGFGSASGKSHGEFAAEFKKVPFTRKLQMLDELESKYGARKRSKKNWLDWDQIRLMDREGIEFVSHTHRHPVLAAEDEGTLSAELQDSKILLEEHLNRPVTLFAYPNGMYSSKAARIAAKVGYTGAFTTGAGFVTTSRDRFSIPRVGIDSSVVENAAGDFSEARARLHILRLARAHVAVPASKRVQPEGVH